MDSVSLLKANVDKTNAINFYSLLDKAKKKVLAQDIISLLTENWCMQTIGNDILYLKHSYCEEEHSLYQIILSNNSEYSGIYKMELRGKDFSCKFDTQTETFMIKTSNFFELSPFYTSKQITELRQKDAIDFKESLIEMVNENNVDHIIFSNNDKKTYIRNVNFQQFKTKVMKFYEKNKATISSAAFIEKKKEYYISRFDLKEDEFKKELIGLGYITEKEYNTYANRSSKIQDILKIEII